MPKLASITSGPGTSRASRDGSPARTYRSAHGRQMFRANGMFDCAKELQQMRKCTYSGRPFREDAFVASMEEQFGRKWRRMRDGGAQRAAVSA